MKSETLSQRDKEETVLCGYTLLKFLIKKCKFLETAKTYSYSLRCTILLFFGAL